MELTPIAEALVNWHIDFLPDCSLSVLLHLLRLHRSRTAPLTLGTSHCETVTRDGGVLCGVEVCASFTDSERAVNDNGDGW